MLSPPGWSSSLALNQSGHLELIPIGAPPWPDNPRPYPPAGHNNAGLSWPPDPSPADAMVDITIFPYCVLLYNLDNHSNLPKAPLLYSPLPAVLNIRWLHKLWHFFKVSGCHYLLSIYFRFIVIIFQALLGGSLTEVLLPFPLGNCLTYVYRSPLAKHMVH